mmetsp:Transcript_41699/g.89530  ORF Transcript_41699/g.89530 Transcript_41699/m.89530 type:complete len:307 (-) Transcript_41699:55-975(-)
MSSLSAEARPKEDENIVETFDEYGDRFADYGFLRRVEVLRQNGNAAFQIGNYQAAIKEYDSALDRLLTVAFDKSIVIGKRKWDDVVVTRSSLHLNKSTCLLKLQLWDESAKAALECLHGSVQETLLYSDPSVRAKVRQAQQSHRASILVEDKLPTALRAKAWFRLAKCYLHLEVFDKAWEAFKKSASLTPDAAASSAALAELRASLERLRRKQACREQKRFAGFFDKLQDQGGYADAKDKARARWNNLSLEEKRRCLEELDDSGDEDSAALGGCAAANLNPPHSTEAGPTFEELMQASADAIGRCH